MYLRATDIHTDEIIDRQTKWVIERLSYLKTISKTLILDTDLLANSESITLGTFSRNIGINILPKIIITWRIMLPCGVVKKPLYLLKRRLNCITGFLHNFIFSNEAKN